tara:strand:+ start:137 stop:898 length:762 start_codon:yes stop_codon:yes gene_type:complete
MSNYLLLENLVLIVFAVFLGGIVKGSVGIGMSMFSVPIIAFILPPTKAMMLLCFPVIFTNFLQMDIKKGVGSFRFLPMFLALFLGLLIGGKLILNLSLNFISISIASVIIIFTSLNFFGISLKNIKKANEKILSVIIGFLSGILGGLTTFYAPPIITFLIAINLDKEFFIRTTATMYFFASIPLYSSMLYHGLGNYYDLIMSLVLVVPAIIGQFFGSKIRKKLSNEIFQKLILIILIMIGFSLLFKNLIYLII